MSFGVVNAGRVLNIAAIHTALKNAQLMMQSGEYTAHTCNFFDGYGSVRKADGTTYNVALPGVVTRHPEGKCNCAQFEKEAICKHIYYLQWMIQAGMATPEDCE